MTRLLGLPLLDRGANVDARNVEGWTALMAAALHGESGTVEALLAHGAEVEARDGFGWEAMMFAACFNSPSVAETLLAHGADVDARTSLGETPLMRLRTALFEKGLRRRNHRAHRLARPFEDQAFQGESLLLIRNRLIAQPPQQVRIAICYQRTLQAVLQHIDS
ncbi:ankyrin repeat domain-containing protein [Halorhodospira abdelmalekii]|uniref:ankyrin repeat domain-containing protein n=1 Tax=Halorhodospira abdelmalekii TaxID=421629 RepID=UPI0030840A31